MAEPLDEQRLERLAGHRRDLVALSDALGLWRGCGLAACRRRGGCRGFAGELLPRCAPRLIEAVRGSLAGCIEPFAGPAPAKPGEPLELTDRLYRTAGMLSAAIERNARAK